ncbi:MAG: NAD(P)/FAD-dependent oxidoreductase, partial [Dehalococcoidia bacterium]|nr:NAD(P)/FAD-dependent oxidoreductase [Dehalococcoidia bacterium]
MKQYDVMVIGGGIAGLGVVGLLQRAGVQTLLLEKSKLPGGRSKTREVPGGWKLDSGIHAVDGGSKSVYAELLKKVGKEIKWSKPIQGNKLFDGSKWLTMEEYFNMSDSEKKLLVDLDKRFANMSDEEIDRLDSVSLTDFIKTDIPSPRVAEFFQVTGMIQSTLIESDEISMGELIYIYREDMKYRSAGNNLGNAQMPVGGIGVATGAQAAAVIEAGGQIEYGVPVEKVELGKGSFTVKAGNNEYTAKKVVLALPIWNMASLISDPSGLLPVGWLDRMKGLHDTTSCSMGFTMGLSKPLFTEPIYLSAWRVPGLGLPLQILGHTNFDETIAPPRHMIAFIGTPCTPTQCRDVKFREASLAKFWEVLHVMFPGFEDNVVWKFDGFLVGIDGLARSPGLTGKLRPPVFMEGIPGLYFAGDCYTGRGVGMNAA